MPTAHRSMDRPCVQIIGGGLAGCEAAWQAACLGCRVVVHEMKPERFSPAHTSADLAELVCSNSLRSDSADTAAGVLKQELRMCESLIMRIADAQSVPAGSALAVDRQRFAAAVTAAVEAHPAISVKRGEVTAIPAAGTVVVASGPLTSDALATHLSTFLGQEFLYFHDAIAPVVEADSVDHAVVFRASRYNKGTADYLNCPLDRQQYYAFIEALCAAETVPLRSFETLKPFEGCMPIEVMAQRGPDTLAFGPMKPVGLIDPRTDAQPFAVVQLRQENRDATLYNLVGFQTRMKWPEQQRVLRMLPGLEHAVFARLGSMHRNTFIDAPRVLGPKLHTRSTPRIFFAGQITGVEGYIESVSSGMVAGVQAAAHAHAWDLPLPSAATVTGALCAHVTGACTAPYQPMNANFGLLPPLAGRVPRKLRKPQYADRARRAMQDWAQIIAQQKVMPGKGLTI